MGHSLLGCLYSPRVLMPTVLVYLVKPIIRLSAQVFIEEEWGFDRHFYPLVYHLLRIAGLGLESLILAPFELARKRMFIQKLDHFSSQNSTSHIPFETIVETHHFPLTGVFHGFGAVIAQEGGKPLKTYHMNEKDLASIYGNQMAYKYGYGSGISSLFRGFWPHFLANTVDYISQEINHDVY